ncbi:MAG: UDP-N-acetylglucosamine 2-epimerase (non-hydrolyzing) [Candidatus Omnitrophica bacterium]|nr:UDP-N-acetylglucosamine 2-epimerase (non-hydrolyzing) [Candidatus Omnitrophota bacterium]
MKIISVVGARPNVMKVAPLARVLKDAPGVSHRLVHTGQHYDLQMSERLFKDLEVPPAVINLGVGSGPRDRQMAGILEGFGRVLEQEEPAWVIVVGDVNSTLACALACSKRGIPVAHVEAGLRSFDRRMPEEINRIETDRLSRLLFTHSDEADENLRREGVPEERIRQVGNVMIDSLIWGLDRLDRAQGPCGLNLRPKSYALLTLHRPENVDDPGTLSRILGALDGLRTRMPVLFPVHPRTDRSLALLATALQAGPLSGILRTEPLGYLDFLKAMREAALVVTDSGGVQEETTYLGIPCVTVRETTERPVTLRLGTNRLAGTSPEAIRLACREALELGGSSFRGSPPPLWDGQAASRIVQHLLQESCHVQPSLPA